MSDLPRNAGRSPTGVALDDSSSESSVPAWLAARRARVPSVPAELPRDTEAAELEPDIEFASFPDAESDADEARVETAPEPPPAVIPVVARDIPVRPKAVIPLPPPPSRRATLDPVRVQAAPAINEPSAGPVDDTLKGRVVRWMKSATMTGLAVSLVVHALLLSVLAVIVFKDPSINRALDIFGIMGEPTDDLSQIELDSSMPIDPGNDAAAVEFSDFSQIATSDKTSFNPSESLRGVPGTGTGSGEGGEGDGIGVAAPNIPKYAVTKGSFSAWTDPKDPEPAKSYEIVIQFRLPPNVKSYKGSDLTGMVIGTDGYKQVIKFSRTESFPVQDGNIQVRIRVPGADRLVRDTIRIESKLLREKQMIEIEF